MVQTDLQKEKSLTKNYIENVKNVTCKHLNTVFDLKNENRHLLQTIKHIKDLIESKNPFNTKNDDISKNFETQSVKSGAGFTSHAGSVTNGGYQNIFGALSSLNYTGDLSNQIN